MMKPPSYLAFFTEAADWATDMVNHISTMMEVRDEWVLHRGEPRNPDEMKTMVDELPRLTLIRLRDPDADLQLYRRTYPTDKKCAREGCAGIVKGRALYCREGWCKKVRDSAAKKRCYEKQMKDPEKKAHIRKQNRESCEALRARRRAAGLTRDGEERKR
jgi:hypothetical protein